jgi:hypothetical protein
MTDIPIAAIHRIVGYNWRDEESDYQAQDAGGRRNHIFSDLLAVRAWLLQAGVSETRWVPLSAPLAERAPEVVQLFTAIGSGEYGTDQLGTLANWFTDNGFEVTDPNDDEEGDDGGWGVLDRVGAINALSAVDPHAGREDLADVLDRIDAGEAPILVGDPGVGVGAIRVGRGPVGKVYLLTEVR